MSLFGDDPDAPAARPKSGLFDDDETTKPKTSSSMFGDSAADADDSSPWGFTPKKSSGKGSLVKSLLANADVPELYIDTFDSLQAGGSVVAADARQLLRDSGNQQQCPRYDLEYCHGSRGGQFVGEKRVQCSAGAHWSRAGR